MSVTMPRRTLQLIVDCRRPRALALDCVRAAVDAGVDWIQVRDHHAPASDFFDLACAVKEISRSSNAQLAVNDRVDVALAVDAEAVQLGARGLDPAVVRRIAPRLAIGVSIHSVDEARAVDEVTVDWLTFGHVFATGTHPGEPPRGVDALREVVRATSRPVIAIGGITEANVDQVVAAGAAGVMVISAILDAADPGAAAASLRRMLDRTPWR